MSSMPGFLQVSVPSSLVPTLQRIQQPSHKRMQTRRMFLQVTTEFNKSLNHQTSLRNRWRVPLPAAFHSNRKLKA
uniref:Putative ovule protein n=1 Tax=Solanum chacoense TaxID=4108 RepID=A0A0V0HHH0_SOLCH